MIFIRDALLFALVALHITGGAALFRRLFPRESPWLGFIIPALAIAMFCNFIEHGIALTGLHWLLLPTTLGSAWLLTRTNWRLLWQPTLVFLVALAIPFILRCFLPIIAIVRDGPEDLSLIANFCMGNTLPPESTWLPGFKVQYYYDFGHYAASVPIRLFGLDVGTGFNVMTALIAGLILFCTGAVAHRLARRRLWIALLVMVMTAAAMDGITDDLWLNHPDFKTPADATDLFFRAEANDHSAYEKFLPRMTDYWATHELIPPGYWCWVGSYHSVAAGQFLIMVSVLCLVEMFNPRRTNWPWIGGVWATLLLLVSSTWCMPIAALFFIVGAVLCVRRGILPREGQFVLMMSVAGFTCLAPMLMYFLRVNTPAYDMPPGAHTPLLEFLMQFWPVYIPWLLLFFWWKRTHPAVRILQVLLPLLFLATEYYSVGARIDMTGKVWGSLFAAGWAVFLPSLLALRSWTLRAVFAAFLVATVISTCFWVDDYHRMIWRSEIGRLSGEGEFHSNPVKERIFNTTSSVHDKIIITDDRTLTSLTGNRDYIGGAFDCTLIMPDCVDEAWKRYSDVNLLYTGKLPNPHEYLLAKGVSMVVIWPNLFTDAAVVANLQTQLAPDYAYVDCRDQPPDDKAPQAGVFVYRDPVSLNHLAPKLDHSNGNAWNIPTTNAVLLPGPVATP